MNFVQSNRVNNFPMWFKSVLLLGLLLVVFRPTQGNPISQENSIVFRLTNTIQINGTGLSELDCISPNSLIRKLCSNITEVTCQKELDQTRSCLVSNEDSIYFNTLVVNQKIECNNANQIKNKCRLTFSPDPSRVLKSTSHPEKKGESVSDSFVISSLNESGLKVDVGPGHHAKKIIIASISVVSFLIFFAAGLFCVAACVNRYCSHGRYGNDPNGGYPDQPMKPVVVAFQNKHPSAVDDLPEESN